MATTVAAADAARATVCSEEDLNDTSGVEPRVRGEAPRPMVVIKASKIERARCAAWNMDCNMNT